MSHRTPWYVLGLLLLTLAGGPQPVQGQSPAPQGLAPREVVTFSTVQTTTTGQSIYILGDLPELGGGDVTRAIKLVPVAYPTWRISISLPSGVTYRYRYLRRNDGPGQTSVASNFVNLTADTTGTTATVTTQARGKVLLLTWDVASPRLFYRRINPGTGAGNAPGPFASVAMDRFGPAVAGRPIAESQYIASNFLPAGTAFEFYFTGPDGVSSRYPASGTYTTRLDGVFVQEGQLYSYVPSAAVSAARRDYNPSSVPTIFSPQLSENRGYRVYLPRGYDQHVTRRYPVLYMHDGQNVFESGAFGSWNAAGTISSLQSSGQMREVIVVGLDNGPNRLTDYLPPTDVLTGVGQGDKYLSYIRDTVKPRIDSTYRTIPDASVTGTLGSSMGGVISLYAGWDFTSTFTKVGLMSGAWQTCGNYLNRVRSTPSRAIRMWLDSGDSGTSNDNYWPTLNLRDYFVASASGSAAYGLAGGVQHTIGYGQQHNEAAWTVRLPAALTFLYPAEEEPSTILRSVFGVQFDVDQSGTVDADDLAALNALLASGSPGTTADVNLDGVAGEADRGTLESYLRRRELNASSARQR